MDNQLKLQVVFAALDKLSGPIRAIGQSSKKLAGALGESRRELKRLEKAQSQLNEFRSLKRGLDETKKKLQEQERAAEKLGRELANTEKPTAKLRREFKAAAAAADKLKQSYHDQASRLKELRSGLDQAGISTSKLASGEKKLRDDIQKTTKAMEAQKDKIGKLNQLKARGDKLKGAGSSISGKGAVASAVTTAPAALLGKQAFDAAMNAQELQSAFDVTFGEQAKQMNAWADATGNAMGRSTQEMQRGSVAFGLFLNQAADPKKAAEMTRTMTILAQDLESFHNLQPGEGIEKLRSGLSGEAEPLKAIGIMMNETTMKAEALRLGLIKKGGTMTEQQKIAARYSLIMKGAGNAHGDVMRTMDSTANQLRRSSGAWEELQVMIGNKLLPKLTPLIEKSGSLLDSLAALPDGAQNAILIFIALIAAIGPLLLMIGPMVFGFGLLSSGAAMLGIGLLPLLGIIAAVVAAIGVFAFLGYQIYQHWDEISAYFGGIWAQITGYFRTNWEQIRNVLLGAMVLFMPLVAAVVWVASFIYRNWDQMKAGLSAFLAYVGTIVGPFIAPWLAVQRFLAGLVAKFVSWGANIIWGLVRGIRSGEAAVIRAIVRLAGSVGKKFASMLGIKSPSRVFMGLGGHITDGLGQGFDKGAGRPVDRMKRLSRDMTAALAIGAATPSIALAGTAAGGNGAGVGRVAAAPAGPITFQIFAAPGQSAESIAQAVRTELERMQRAADARQRSSYIDD